MKYKWDDSRAIITSLMQACKLQNDRFLSRLPIQKGLLELILFEINRIYQDQVYLNVIYKAIFALAYYGLFRVGELTTSEHVAKAVNVHVATNKQKILVILYTSKTHGLGNRPQKIKISAQGCKNIIFCLFMLMRNFIRIRGGYQNTDEPLFIFREKSPVTALHVRKLLSLSLNRMGLDSSLYAFHSFRVGRTTDMCKGGFSMEEIKRRERWRSNAVYK